MARKKAPKKVESIRHAEDSRKNIPTAEFRAVMAEDERTPIEVAYQRRNRDLDPQLVWRDKDEQDQGDLIAQATPLYIQEKVHPKVLIDDLVQHAKDAGPPDEAIDLFADFNGLPPGVGQTDFYEHDPNWSNRMILGDSLHVMASLAEREDLRGKVQCIYFDPPYGIKFNSNFQWSTTSRDVKDGNRKHITREPEQVKAFRDTWRDGVHSYLTYIRDRLTAARDLLSESGSIFVQIGDENVHRVRALMDEVFGEENFVSLISYAKTTGFSSRHLSSVCDYLVWYAKARPGMKFRTLVEKKVMGGPGAAKYRPASSFKALATAAMDPIRENLNALLETQWQEWEIPREPEDSWPPKVQELHSRWWSARIALQKEIDASIAAKAPFEFLYDKPYQAKNVVRVAGPFTVESLSPHRMLPVGVDDELVGLAERSGPTTGVGQDFAGMILDQLRTAGVQQARRSDRVDFTALTGWPGEHVCAVGQYLEGNRVRQAGVLIGPEFGTVSRPDLAAAAREAAEAGFDTLVACAFNYDAQSADFAKLGRVPIIKARMNADLHMADELKNTGKGNLFVVFGEPDIEIHDAGAGEIQVEIKGVDVFHPSTGEIRADDTNGIACWFIDTDYNEESFFVRQAYFLGANDPYKALKTTLRAEIDQEAWATLRRSVSRPFSKPASGRIAVKVINHLGDEAMRVFLV